MRNHYYYAVNAYNCVAVCNKWSRVKACQKYMKGLRTKGFNTKEEATLHAKEVAEAMLPDFCTVPETLDMNHIYYIREMKQTKSD